MPSSLATLRDGLHHFLGVDAPHGVSGFCRVSQRSSGADVEGLDAVHARSAVLHQRAANIGMNLHGVNFVNCFPDAKNWLNSITGAL